MSQQDPFADQNESTNSSNQNTGAFNQTPNSYTPGTYQIPLPNSTGALVLGICAIVGSFCYAIPGIICGIIGLILANGGEKLYKAEPSKYTTQSYNNNKAGKITSIIGLALGGVVLVAVIIYFIAIAAVIGSARMYY